MENLNQEQLKAVLHKEGPLLIVAGAGTGKTTVISQKIAYIIEQGWAKADEILALTFTEKAAGEMEERVDRLLPMGYLDLWISTFHGFGERILKAHGLDIGLPNNFKLLNEFEQYALIKNNFNKFELDYYRPMGNPTKFIHALVKHFSRAKDEDISPGEYLKYAEGLKEDRDEMLGGKKKVKSRKSKVESRAEDSEGEQEAERIYEVANAYHTYQQLLLDNSALDFGDLINYCLKLFRERPAILSKYQKQFKYILLDEFQDTNLAQYELIKLLIGPKGNLTVVGDDDQSIYKFRGASVSNILQFKKDYPKAKQIFLVQNYRNCQNILDLSYKFITLNNPNRLEYRLNEEAKNKGKTENNEFSKELIANNKSEGVIEVIEGNNLPEEIKMIIEKIADLKIKDKDTTWNDFAILVRANDSAKEICSFLAAAQLPYQFLSSRGLYVKPAIMDTMAYLKLLDNYHENTAMYRVLNLPIFGFTYTELVNFNYWAGKRAWSLYETLRNVATLNLGANMQKKVEKVMSLIATHTAMARGKGAKEVILAWLNDSGYLKYLLEQGEQESREVASFLSQFLKRVEKFEAGSADKSVKAFIAELDMEIDAGEEGSIPVDWEAGPETIKVMTAHGAKGLEFKYVFISGMVDKRFPTIERSEAIDIPNALVKEVLPEGDVHLEEERRLFYVAVTRAKNNLYFSWAKDYGGARDKKPSRFLAECGLVRSLGVEKKQEVVEASEDKKNKILGMLENKPAPAGESNFPFRVPSFFSYTQLAAFSNCPYQYRFAHVLKIPLRGKAQFSFGKTLHLVLQNIFRVLEERGGFKQTDLFGVAGKGSAKTAGITLEEILDFYEKNWIDDWYANKAQKEEYKKKGKKILNDFFEKYKDNWPSAIFLEKGFNFKIEVDRDFYTIRGVMDRVDEGDKKIKIVDYKTGAPKDKLSFDEKYQLLIYQLAAKDLFPQEIGSLAFYYLDNNSEVEFLGSEDELEKTREKISGTIKEIKKGEFPAKPSALCKFCDFASICEYRKS